MVWGGIVIRVVLWAATALFLVASGYLVLHACGTSLSFLNYCASEPISRTQVLRDENRRLGSRREDLLAQLNRAPQCRIEEEQARKGFRMGEHYFQVLAASDGKISLKRL